MSLKESLDIVLITYNRKDELKKTLNSILSEASPIKDFDITILNNASTDGTTELINKYCEKFSNLKHIVNKKNIGGCANIAKAFVEIPSKKYFWVLCDNDEYDWTAWSEVENAISQEYNVITTRKCKTEIADIYRKASLVSGCIYKTEKITDTVAQNIYDASKNLFPHLALMAKNINDNSPIYIVSKNIVDVGINPNQHASYTRGLNVSDLPDSRKYVFWHAGFISSLELINDKQKRCEIIDGTTQEHKSVFGLFKSAVVLNKVYYNNFFFNFVQIFRILNFKQKLLFILAYLTVNLSFKDYTFYEMTTKSDWKDFLDKIDEKKYIKKLEKKYRKKKILLYGAGTTAEVILENYDLSEFNIIGISDQKFEKTNETNFHNIKTIKPSELNNYHFDTILFTLKLYNKAEKALKDNGIKANMQSLIKKDNKYVIRT